MILLLDTHILLWIAEDSRRLPAKARDLIEDTDNTLMFSAANIWEVVIKRARGRRDFQTDPADLRDALLARRYLELPMGSMHTLAVSRLPLIHDDPFDRILIAQAIVEEARLVTTDGEIAQYVAQYPDNILVV